MQMKCYRVQRRAWVCEITWIPPLLRRFFSLTQELRPDPRSVSVVATLCIDSVASTSGKRTDAILLSRYVVQLVCDMVERERRHYL